MDSTALLNGFDIFHYLPTMGSSWKGKKNFESWEISIPGKWQIKLGSLRSKSKEFSNLLFPSKIWKSESWFGWIDVCLPIGTAFHCSCLQSQYGCTNKETRFHCTQIVHVGIHTRAKGTRNCTTPALWHQWKILPS